MVVGLPPHSFRKKFENYGIFEVFSCFGWRACCGCLLIGLL